MQQLAAPTECDVYGKRWVILAALSLTACLVYTLSKSFGIADQIFAAYFEITLTEIDWATSGVYAGMTIFAPFLAYFCFIGAVGFRIMSIAAALAILFPCIVIVLSILFPVLLPGMIASTLLQGLASSITLCGGPYFVVLWFPDHQTAVAYPCILVANSVGMMLGCLIPPLILEEAPLIHEINSTSFTYNRTEVWIESTKITLLWFYTVIGLLTFCTLIYFAVEAEDKPPKPPSMVLLQRETAQSDPGQQTFVGFLKQLRLLFMDKTFIIITIVSSVVYFMFIIEILHLSQIVDKVIQFNSSNQSSSVIGGLIVVVHSISALISSFPVAKVLDQYHCHFKQIIFGGLVGLLGALVMLISYYYSYLPGLYVGTVFMAINSRAVTIALVDALTRHTYPANEAVVFLLHFALNTTIYAALAALVRLVTNLTSPASSIIFIAVCYLVALVLPFFMEIKNNRAEEDQQPQNKTTDSTPLLSNYDST